MSKFVKRVSYIDGVRVTRPALNHPNPSYWSGLRKTVFDRQIDNDGLTHCATCWDTSGVFDLHHRHYDNFGQELVQDVVLLCRPCHDAITNRIRSERFALGDQTFGGELSIEQGPSVRFQPTRKATAVVEAGLGEARHGRAWLGGAWRGLAWRGGARSGMAGPGAAWRGFQNRLWEATPKVF